MIFTLRLAMLTFMFEIFLKSKRFPILKEDIQN